MTDVEMDPILTALQEWSAKIPEDIICKIYGYLIDLSRLPKSLKQDIELHHTLFRCFPQRPIFVYTRFLHAECKISPRTFFNRYPFRPLVDERDFQNYMWKRFLESENLHLLPGGKRETEEERTERTKALAKAITSIVGNVSVRQKNAIYGLMTPQERYRFIWHTIQRL